MFKKSKKTLGLFMAVIMLLGTIVTHTSEVMGASAVDITNSGSWFEAAYAQWNDYQGASGYNAYYKLEAEPVYIKVDDELVRENRVDIPGLRGNSKYEIKIVPIVSGDEDEAAAATFVVTPAAYDRSGFAFSPESPNKVTTGGYNADGTVPANAEIIYVTDATKDTVVYKMKNPVKGKVDTYIGIKNILDSREKTKDTTPLIIRLIGIVNQPSGVDSLELLTAKKTSNITIEGIGSDSGVFGWGINIREDTNIEVRNLSFGGQADDCISVQVSNRNIWLHNNDFFWGKNMGGDKAKGDGSADVKQDSSFVTLSYNRYHDTGKGALIGQGDKAEFFVTMHHNYFDASDSRHPRVRYGSVHVYNNYFKDIDKYGVGAGEKSSIFVENNYFENTSRPMIMSQQGHALDKYTGTGAYGGSGSNTLSSDSGGAIKQVGNYLDEASKVNFNEEYDTGNSKFDNWVFNDFDSRATMYSYTAETPEDARATVIAYAGRMKDGTTLPELPDPLPAPASLAVTAGTPSYNTVELSWAAVEGATGYRINYGISETDLKTTVNAVGTDVSATITGLDSNTSYYFAVSTLNGSVVGESSNVVAARTDISNIPVIKIAQQPAKTIYTVGDAALDTAGMAVNLIVGLDTTPIALDDADLSFSGFNSASAAASQTITVMYQHAGKTLTAAFTIKVVAVVQPPSTDGSVAMGNYTLNSSYVTKGASTVDNISYNLEAVEAARIKLKGNGTNFVAFKVSEECTFETDPSNKGIILSTVDGNIIYNSVTSQSITTPVGNVIVTLQPGTYKIVSAAAGDNTYLTKFVFTATGAVAEPVNVPSNLAVVSDAVTEKAVTLTWDKVDGATGYVLYYGTSETSMSSSFAVSSGDTVSAAITPLAANTTYYFTIVAQKGNVNSQRYTPAVLAKTNASLVPTIKISAEPAKKIYFVGDAADYTGLEVKLCIGTDETVISFDALQIEGFDTSSAGTKNVTVKYNDATVGILSAAFSITVKVQTPPVVDADWKWNVSGASATLAGNTFVKNGDKSVTISASSSAGKIAKGSNVGMGFYYTEVKASDDFVLTAKVDAAAIAADSQASYGLMLRDKNGVHGDSTPFAANYVAVGALGNTAAAKVGIYAISDKSTVVSAAVPLGALMVPATLVATDYNLTIDKKGEIIKVTVEQGNEVKSFTYKASDFFSTEATIYVGMYAARSATATFSDFSLTIEKPKIVTSIELVNIPTDNFHTGDEPDWANLQIWAYYEDSASELIDIESVEMTGYDKENAGEQTITVVYGGQTAAFNINVIQTEVTAIQVAYLPSKINYYVGETLDTLGLVVNATLNSGKTVSLASSEYTVEADTSEVGTPAVTVTYGANDSLTAVYIIKVSSFAATGIMIKQLPVKINYFLGEELDLKGLQVFEAGAAYPLGDGHYEISGFDSDTVGQKIITVAYKGFTDTIIVSVKQKEQTGYEVTQVPSKTTYDIGQDFDSAGIIVSAVYDNGDKVKIDNYTLDTTAYNKDIAGQYNIKVLVDGAEVTAFSVSARKVVAATWKTTVFGQSTNSSDNYFKYNDSKATIADGAYKNGVSVAALNAKGGKITGSHDGMSFYYTEVNAKEDNFVLTATVEITSFMASSIAPNNQEAFGLAARDSNGVNGESAVYTSNMVFIGGYRQSLQAVMRTGIEADGSAGSATMTAVDLNNNQKPTGTHTYTLRKTNSGFYMKLDNLPEVFYAEPDILQIRDENTIYVGFFAARDAEIKIIDSTFTTTKAATDAPRVYQPTTPTKPSLQIVSLSASAYQKYDLKLLSNVNGFVTVTNSIDGEQQSIYVKANQVAVLPGYILALGENRFTASLTPDGSQNLSSYDNVISHITVSYKVLEITGEALFVSPNGKADAEGTRENPLNLETAISYVKPGETIIMLSGTYYPKGVITIPFGNDGTVDDSGKILHKTLKSEGGVIIDFGAKGNFVLSGNYWHIYGIDFIKQTSGFRTGGNNNIIELCNFYRNGDTGFQISRTDTTKNNIADWPSNNLVLNCTSYFNEDPSNENADGFAAKLTSGVGNVFRGCIAHHNIDDGWDLYTKAESGPIGAILIDGCVSYKNGFKADGSEGNLNADRNGFKLGGEGIPVKHIIQNSIAFDNGATGFTSNSNPAVRAYNNIAYNNAVNIKFSSYFPELLDFDVQNFISYKSGDTDKIEGFTSSSTVWLNGKNSTGNTIKDDTFESLSQSGIVPYNRDEITGDIIRGSFLKLKTPFALVPTLGKVEGLKVKQVGFETILTWSSVAGAAGYEVTLPDGSTVNSPIAQYTYAWTDIAELNFRVRAVDSIGEGFGEYATDVSITPVSLDIERPVINSISGDEATKVTIVAWDRVEGANKYVVEVVKDDAVVKEITTSLTSWRHVLPEFGEYSYMVTAYSAYAQNTSETVQYTIGEVIVPVEGIAVTGKRMVRLSEAYAQYTAVVTPSNATNKEVEWTVNSMGGTATISEGGVLTPESVGTVVITATTKDDSGIYGSMQVEIKEEFDISDLTTLLEEATEKLLDLQYTQNSRDTLSQVIYGIDAEAIEEAGDIGALDEAMLALQNAINALEIAVTSITVSLPTNPDSLEIGESIMLIATVKPDNATHQEVVWTVSDDAIAMIEDGLLTTLSEGIVTVTAAAKDDSGITGTIDISVNATPIVELELTALNDTLELCVMIAENGDAYTSGSLFRLTEATEATRIKIADEAFSSQDEIDNEIVLLKAAIDSLAYKVSGIIITGEGSVTVGQIANYAAIVAPENAENKYVSWNVSDATVATIDKNGTLTAIKDGIVVITAKAEDESAVSGILTVTVIAPIIELPALDLTELDNLLVQAKNSAENTQYTLLSRLALTVVITSIETARDAGFASQGLVNSAVIDLRNAISTLLVDTPSNIYIGYDDDQNSSVPTSQAKIEETVVLEEGKVALGSVDLVQEKPLIKDIDKASVWAREFVVRAYENDLITLTDDRFDPQAAVTRGEFIAMILKANDIKPAGAYKKVFSDVSDTDPNALYIQAAFELGFVSGVGEGKFNPNTPVTRQDMAVILVNVTGITGDSNGSDFKDFGIVADYAKSAVATVFAKQIMVGVGDNMFNPYGIATKEMSATVVVKVFESK